MNSSIFKSLKDNFVNASNSNNKSIVELCITELSSGNFPKAVDLSEELIKKDINDSVGWATKALSQAHLFDYQNNLYFLKSSLTSLDEFKAKTTLSKKDVIAVEAMFAITSLDRTITLVRERLQEVIELKLKAKIEKDKSKAATIGAALSAYAAIQSKSDVGKVLGYGGAIAGATASTHFNLNAELLNSASKGVFGVAVANITMTIGSAMTLNSILNELDYSLREEASNILENWLISLLSLYDEVKENLIIYAEEVLSSGTTSSSINLNNASECVQFIILSHRLGIINSDAQIKKIEAHLLSLAKTDVNQSKSENESIFKKGSVVLLLGILVMVFINFNLGFILLLIAFGALVYFLNSSNSVAGRVAKTVRELLAELKKLKVSSDKIIVENMIPQDIFKIK